MIKFWEVEERKADFIYHTILPNPNGLLFNPSSHLLFMLPIPLKVDRMDLAVGSDGEELEVAWVPAEFELSDALEWLPFKLFISAFKSEKLSDVFMLENEDKLLKLIEPLIICKNKYVMSHNDL